MREISELFKLAEVCDYKNLAELGGLEWILISESIALKIFGPKHISGLVNWAKKTRERERERERERW